MQKLKLDMFTAECLKDEQDLSLFVYLIFCSLLWLMVDVICSVWASLLCQDKGSPLRCALLSSSISFTPHSGVCHSLVFSTVSRQRENEEEDERERNIREERLRTRIEKRVWWCQCQWGVQESSMKAAWRSTNWMSPTLLIRTMKAIIITVGCRWDAIFRCIQLAYCVWASEHLFSWISLCV